MIRPVATLPRSEQERLRATDDIDVAPTPSGASWLEGMPVWFKVVEVLLVLAVPLLAFVGARELLNTTAGTFTSLPGPGEPGWRALVDPSPVSAIAETFEGRVTGVTLVTQAGADVDGGAVVLVSADLLLDDGRTLADLAPADAIAEVGRQLRLGFGATYVLDIADWRAVVQDREYQLDNPDPIPAGPSNPEIPVGDVTIDADTVAAFLGVADPEADSRSLVFRRRQWWEAVLADPPSTDHPLAVVLARVGTASQRVDDLPVETVDDHLKLLPGAAEQLVNEVVPLPRGSVPGDRTVIRVVDRTGQIDTSAVAVALGRRGYEVSEIANASVFDQGPTEIVVPAGVSVDALRGLAAELGAATVSPDPVEESAGDTVVLLVGSDIDLD